MVQVQRLTSGWCSLPKVGGRDDVYVRRVVRARTSLVEDSCRVNLGSGASARSGHDYYGSTTTGLCHRVDVVLLWPKSLYTDSGTRDCHRKVRSTEGLRPSAGRPPGCLPGSFSTRCRPNTLLCGTGYTKPTCQRMYKSPPVVLVGTRPFPRCGNVPFNYATPRTTYPVPPGTRP